MGRGSTSTVGEGAWPKITTVAPWDGKDGEVGGPMGRELLVYCHYL